MPAKIITESSIADISVKLSVKLQSADHAAKFINKANCQNYTRRSVIHCRKSTLHLYRNSDKDYNLLRKNTYYKFWWKTDLLSKSRK